MTELTGVHRDALIEATVDEFANAGYEAASLNRIIRAAGISKSSFYHAVSSKAELFDAVISALIGDVQARWQPPAATAFSGDAFWPTVDEVLVQLGALTAADRSLALLGRVFHLPATGESDARGRMLAGIRRWVGEVLQVGVASGAVRDDVATDALAAAVFGMLRGLDEWALAEETDAAAAASAVHAPVILLRGLLTPPAR